MVEGLATWWTTRNRVSLPHGKILYYKSCALEAERVKGLTQGPNCDSLLVLRGLIPELGFEP